MSNRMLEQIRCNDVTVARILADGGSETDCIAALVEQKRKMLERICELEAIAPRAYRRKNGEVLIWRCPDRLIPLKDL